MGNECLCSELDLRLKNERLEKLLITNYSLLIK